jgi:hypothetical protein
MRIKHWVLALAFILPGLPSHRPRPAWRCGEVKSVARHARWLILVVHSSSIRRCRSRANSPALPVTIRPKAPALNPAEIDDVAAFLGALTDGYEAAK